MTIQDYASFAHIFTAVGIVSSLIFMGLQLRSSNTLFRIQQREARLLGLMTYRSYSMQPGFSDFLMRARSSFVNLTESEQQTFETYCEIAAPSITSLHLNAAISSVTAEQSRAFALLQMAALVDHPGGRQWWAERRGKALIGGPAESLIDSVIGVDGNKGVVPSPTPYRINNSSGS